MKPLSIILLLGLAVTAAAGERCLIYRVARICREAAPKVDGKLDDHAWRRRDSIRTLRRFLGPGIGDFASQKSEFTVLCDGRDLYIGARLHENEMRKLRANPANQPFWNDCIEIYFDPRNDGTRSIQLVIDCLGRKWWQKQSDDGYGWKEDKAWYMLADWQAKTSRDSDAWTIEIRINCKAFGIDPAPGNVIGFNPCRFRLGAGKEFTAWGFGGSTRQKSIRDWGHLLFAAGDVPPGKGVTIDDIRAVYGKLKDQTIEVPVAGGLQIFTADGTETKSFQELLSQRLQVVKKGLEEAQRALDKLHAGKEKKAPMAKNLAAMHAQTVKLRESVGEKLSIGQFDRLAAEFDKLERQLKTLQGEIRFVDLIMKVRK